MRHELTWFVEWVRESDGIHFLTSSEWSPHDFVHPATQVAYVDASGVGIGIWFLGENAGFQCPLPEVPQRMLSSSLKLLQHVLLSTFPAVSKKMNVLLFIPTTLTSLTSSCLLGLYLPTIGSSFLQWTF
jgi:hypothetical protein